MTVLVRREARLTRRAWMLATLLLAGLASASGGRAVQAHAGHGMPARLQQGTCDAIGPVAFELTGVGATEDVDGNEVAEPEVMGAPSAVPVEASVTTVAASLNAIVDGGHAIVVSESDDAMDVIVTCGDVGGIVVNGDLIVGLKPQGEEGMTGTAIFHPDGEQTVVSVYLMPAVQAGVDGGTPEA
jgi:hypothetical protein